MNPLEQPSWPDVLPARPLETQRLTLRQWRVEDVAPFVAMSADPEIMHYFGATQPFADVMGFLARTITRIDTHGWGWWAVEEKGGSPFVGVLGVSPSHETMPYGPVLEIGWRLMKSAWGKGYATEGARAVLDFCWNQLNGTEVVAVTAAGNGPSRRVMERIGMHYDPAADFIHPRPPADSPHRHSVLYRVMAPGGSAAPGGSSK